MNLAQYPRYDGAIYRTPEGAKFINDGDVFEVWCSVCREKTLHKFEYGTAKPLRCLKCEEKENENEAKK